MLAPAKHPAGLVLTLLCHSKPPARTAGKCSPQPCTYAFARAVAEQAEFYTCASTGAGIPASLRGGGPASRGCRAASISDPVLKVRSLDPRLGVCHGDGTAHGPRPRGRLLHRISREPRIGKPRGTPRVPSPVPLLQSVSTLLLLPSLNAARTVDPRTMWAPRAVASNPNHARANP